MLYWAHIHFCLKWPFSAVVPFDVWVEYMIVFIKEGVEPSFHVHVWGMILAGRWCRWVSRWIERRLFGSCFWDGRCETSNEVRAWDISGLMEAKVRDLSSVPYLCFTSLGNSGWMSWSQVRTTKFSNVGVNSSSSVTRSPWCDKLLAWSKMSSTKAVSHQVKCRQSRLSGHLSLETQNVVWLCARWTV